MAGGRAGFLLHEVCERGAQGVGDEQEVGVAGISLPRFIPLDGAALKADALGELILGEAGGATGGNESFA